MCICNSFRWVSILKSHIIKLLKPALTRCRQIFIFIAIFLWFAFKIWRYVGQWMNVIAKLCWIHSILSWLNLKVINFDQDFSASRGIRCSCGLTSDHQKVWSFVDDVRYCLYLTTFATIVFNWVQIHRIKIKNNLFWFVYLSYLRFCLYLPLLILFAVRMPSKKILLFFKNVVNVSVEVEWKLKI